MELVKSAVFRTYGGVNIPVDFTFPLPRVERNKQYTKEKLADFMAAQTQQSGDPIVQCVSIETA